MNNVTICNHLPNSEDESTFEDKIICETDVLINDDSTSNGDKSESETQFEFLDTSNNNSKIHLVSFPVLQDIDTKASWTRIKTKALLEEYTIMLDHFRTPDRKQKDLWIQLAARMQAKGYQVTWEMCNRKFRNLKQTYRTIHCSNRPEKNKKRWEFYDDLSVLIPPLSSFGRKKSVSSSSSSPILQETLNIENLSVLKVPSENKFIVTQPNSSSPELFQTNQSNISMEYQRDPPAWFKEFLVQFKVGQDNIIENIRKMHIESKQLEVRKIRLLENILSLMNKSKN